MGDDPEKLQKDKENSSHIVATEEDSASVSLEKMSGGKKEGGDVNGSERQDSESTKRVLLYKLFVFADTFDIIMMVCGTLGAIVNGVGLPAMSVVFGSLIDAFGDSSVQSLNAVLHRVTTVVLRFVYVGIAVGVGSLFQVTCWMTTGERQAARIRSLYLQTILRQDIAFFDTETSTGEVIGTMSGDTTLVQEAMGEKVGTFVQMISTFVGGFIIAFVKGWRLALVLLAVIPLVMGVGAVMALIITKSSARGQKAYSEANGVVEQAVGAIRTVVSFGGEKRAINEYDKFLKPAHKAAVEQGLATGLGLGCFLLIMFCTYALSLWYGSRLIINEGYSGGRVINVIFAFLTGGLSLGQTSPSINAFAAGQAAAYRMFQIFKRTPEIDVYDTSGIILEDVQGDIELNDVSFRYPARPDVQIFSGFTLHIPRGTTTAIVGESGSGKSTVISLIERFYDLQSGEILIDGVDIKKFQLRWLRGTIGLVSQEPVLFATTIKENIAYGKEGATVEEIKAAAELANATKFIDKMPQGFDTMVGEHGTQLSGGQKQRIAIARAILKDPRILLLDEATSALDTESERIVQVALDRIMVNRTTVIVAHRLTTVRNADMIAVLQHGSIVEKGSHSLLIANPQGAYFQLVNLQAMHETKEEAEKDPDEIENPVDDPLSMISGPVPSLKRYSFRSRSSASSGFSGSHRFKDEGQSEEIGAEKKKPLNTFSWFSRPRKEGDIEDGGSEDQQNISLTRLAVMNKPEIPVLLVGSLAAAAVGLSFPFFGLLLSSIINSFFKPPHELRKDANFWSGMFVVLACAMLLSSPIQHYCFAVAGGKLVQRIRSLTFKKVIYQDIGWFDEDENSSGVIVARLSTDAANVRSLVGDSLSLFVQNIATIVAGLVIGFTANWKLAFLLIALVPLYGLQGYVQVALLQGFAADAKTKYEKASQVATEAVGSIRTVASFCAEEKVLRLYKDRCSSPLKAGTKKGLVSGAGLGLSNFMMFASYALIFYVGARMVKDGQTTFGHVFKVFFAIAMAAFGISQSIGLTPDFGKVKTSAISIFGLLDGKSKIDASNLSGVTLDNVKGDIKFQHVSFTYPARPEVQIFKDLNMFFPSGKTTALVGESGSGKSTVIALLQRFYDPDSGHILLDGVEIKELQIKWLRQQMGLVSQEPVLFNDTIRSNISYGKDGIVSEEEIIEAAKASNAHGFISTLPEGYDTAVGERGMQLSGGQKQRIAIARAILKDPKILLLDEATSALDAESERLVQDALDHVKLNRTTIVVAHRLSTIKDSDIIAVVKNGVIAEQGKHDALLSTKDGAYATLVKLYMASS